MSVTISFTCLSRFIETWAKHFLKENSIYCGNLEGIISVSTLTIHIYFSIYNCYSSKNEMNFIAFKNSSVLFRLLLLHLYIAFINIMFKFT